MSCMWGTSEDIRRCARPGRENGLGPVRSEARPQTVSLWACGSQVRNLGAGMSRS